MGKISKTYVPSDGPTDAKIMVVGEAPGRDEEQYHIGNRHVPTPFVGRSGELLNRYLARCGVKRKPRQDDSEVFATNLSKHRPKGNRFHHLKGSSQLADGLSELKEEIKGVDPNIIIALGGWPMYYLTGQHGKQGPGSGISNWRGSTLPCTLVEGYKVYCAYHPAYILRVWNWNPVFLFDIQRAVEESDTKELPWPEYEEHIDPDEFTLIELVEEMENAELITIDIETFGSELACIGFTSNLSWGLCLTFQRPGDFGPTPEILSNSVPKCFQFGNYDVNWLHRFMGWETKGYLPSEGMGWDTYIAAATLMPEFPRGLDFLTSIYTRIPYYKEERKLWKKSGDLTTLWQYNIKDIIATHEIATKQIKEMSEKFGVEVRLGHAA